MNVRTLDKTRITLNKRKILNDPVYGFITMPSELIFDLVEHPYFQRLRRIKQVGMSHLVYPGALHTRFHHALGAMHLMSLAISALREKDVVITADEAEGALVAILLHDIGHGPFSHSLEYSLVENVNHEVISGLLMERLNRDFDNRLTTGINIFNNRISKHFLHQLVSSQLDMDRLDYLSRDSFYTGVSEGVVSNQRIIKMLNVFDNKLVVEEKGIYSIEKFIVARRLMYWQVYLHKTVVAAEKLLISILRRAKFCVKQGQEVFGSPALQFFLKNNFSKEDFISNPKVIDTFVLLDDFDIMGAIKVWQNHDDKILSDLSFRLVNRKLMRVVLCSKPIDPEIVKEMRETTKAMYHLQDDEVDYYFSIDEIENNAYDPKIDRIDILRKGGKRIDLAEASDNQSMLAQTQTVKKQVIYLPKDVNKIGWPTNEGIY